MGLDITVLAVDWARLEETPTGRRLEVLEDAAYPDIESDWDAEPEKGWVCPAAPLLPWIARYEFHCTSGSYKPHFWAGEAWEDVREFAEPGLRESLDGFLRDLFWHDDPTPPPLSGLVRDPHDRWRPGLLLACPPVTVSHLAARWADDRALAGGTAGGVRRPCRASRRMDRGLRRVRRAAPRVGGGGGRGRAAEVGAARPAVVSRVSPYDALSVSSGSPCDVARRLADHGGEGLGADPQARTVAFEGECAERARRSVAYGEDVQVLRAAGGRVGLQGRRADQVPPAHVGVAVAAGVGRQREGRLFLGPVRAGVEVVHTVRLGVRQAQCAGRRDIAVRRPAHAVAVVGGVRQAGEQIRRPGELFHRDGHPQARAVGDIQGPHVSQDVVAADDRLGDQLGREALGAGVPDADLTHRAAEQEAVRHRAEAVLPVHRSREVVRARRLDQRRGHTVVEGHRDRARTQLVAGRERRRTAVPAGGVLDLPDQHPGEVTVDSAVRLDRVPAPPAVASVPAEVGADAPAEVAQAQDRLERAVLLAVARAAVVEAAARESGVDVAGEGVAVLGEDLLAADPVSLGEEGQGDRAVVVVVRAAVLGRQQRAPVRDTVGADLVGVQGDRPRTHLLALARREVAGQHQPADDAADGLVAGLLRIEEGRLGQPAPVAVRHLEEFGALLALDKSLRQVQHIDGLEERPHRARPVADGVGAGGQGVTGVGQSGVAGPQVRVAGVVLGVHPLAQMEGEAAAHRLRQARVLAALPGEGEK